MQDTDKLANDFRSWVLDKKSNPRFMYHKGYLAQDRWVNWQMEMSPVNVPIDNLAKAAWDAYEAGLVHLTQSRLAEGVYLYWATKTWEARE